MQFTTFNKMQCHLRMGTQLLEFALYNFYLHFGMYNIYSLNFINFYYKVYYTSVIQKAHGTYMPVGVLEGAVVHVLWSNIVEETGEPWENN